MSSKDELVHTNKIGKCVEPLNAWMQVGISEYYKKYQVLNKFQFETLWSVY